jgi:hypothetical protein
MCEKIVSGALTISACMSDPRTFRHASRKSEVGESHWKAGFRASKLRAILTEPNFARQDQFPFGSTVKLRVTTSIMLSELAGAPALETIGIPVMGSKIALVVAPVDAVR